MVYERKSGGVTSCTYREKPPLAAPAIVAIGNWVDVSVISSRDTSKQSGLKFATAPGAISFAGSFSSGTFPNSIQASIPEPRLLAVLAPGWSRRRLLLTGLPTLTQWLSSVLCGQHHPPATTMGLWRMQGEKFCACVAPTPMSTLQKVSLISTLQRWWVGCCRKGFNWGGSSGWMDCSSPQIYCYLTWSCR